jgi:hypothetical protein
MWNKIAHIILRNRILFLVLISLITAFMAYHAQFAEMSYDYTSAVPKDDPDMIYFNRFKQQFGEDGTILAVGLKNDKIYELKHFKELRKLTDNFKKLDGVKQVVALPQMQYLFKDTVSKRFEARPVFPENQALTSQKQLDSLVSFAQNQKFYEEILFNPENKAIAVLLSIDKNVIESANRQVLVQNIQNLGSDFTEKTGITIHYAGLPFIRSILAGKVAAELKVLLMLSGIATALILFVFFRSFVAVIFPMIIIGIVVIWSVGMIQLFGLKITILMGLLPPILVVIGIPNCVYLLNKYHQEYRYHQNQAKALQRIIRKIGLVTLMTNMTTAIGFAVFFFMDNKNLSDFGLVSCLSIVSTFLVSIILLPIFYSMVAPPTEKQLKHLDRKPLHYTLEWLHVIVSKYRRLTYVVVLILIVVAFMGFLKIKVISFMVDNLPEDSLPKRDLTFFEDNFTGAMPLEILVDTKRKKGVMTGNTLDQVDKFMESLKEVEWVSEPISILALIKASRQAFYNNDPAYYALPDKRERPFILRYLQGGQDSTSQSFLNTLVDSTGQQMRISLKVKDVGSNKLDSLVNQVIRPKIAESFKDKRMDVSVTGTTLIFLRGNDYLVKSIRNSLLLAIILISGLMALLFGSFRMIVISIISNLLPLLITAGVMGYFDIYLKPSNALVFSIAFGIAIDDSIHFLARYRQELFIRNYDVKEAVSVSLRETGTGMIYTSIILFFGFIVFVYSTFDGTVALGALTSSTLLLAMVSNLILLPSLLITFGSKEYRRSQIQLIDYYDESAIFEADDEEIDLSLIRVRKQEDKE